MFLSYRPSRRFFLRSFNRVLKWRPICFQVSLLLSAFIASSREGIVKNSEEMSNSSVNNRTVRLFLSGDVMLGRGVDQILQYHVNPTLFEGYVRDARRYVQLAVQVNGPLPENRSIDYVWGDAIEIFKQMKPDLRIINLETSVTERGDPWPHKGINYRMHPKNIPVILSAEIHCCVLSNNHVLDWGYQGFTDTLVSLARANIKVTGAGSNSHEAQAPAIFDLPQSACRLLIFGVGSHSAGVPEAWSATDSKGGVHVIDEGAPGAEMDQQISRLKQLVEKYRRPLHDLVMFSVHWGGNWGWNLEKGQKSFAHRLIDDVGVDVVHGHSSHHIKGVEIYKGKLVAYGCGDLLSDYEGIQNEGEQQFRDDLSLMYFVDLNPSSGNLAALHLAPMRLRHMQIKRATGEDEIWLFENFKRQCFNIGRLHVERVAVNGTNLFQVIF